ncbi:S8 family peptidase [Microbacterium ureisolvens]|uniref:S8 family serine peptidase n=1 Tax=Microbacterium ureisolvens TaxID=2781186 RepID=A0ABS7HWM2_9MICO|nr:S8 family peptidase [Microbacterium ureisolvens]MBW9109495.1 S8 family serine peptidase [Microbacterium ureisolvens]
MTFSPRRAAAVTAVVALASCLALATAPAFAAPADEFESGRYIVTLKGAPVATYSGSLPSYRATQPEDGNSLNPRAKAAAAYADHLSAEQEAVAADADAEIVTSYTLATNGFASALSAEQAADLAADPRVASIVKDELLHLQTATPSTDYIGLSGDDGVWASLGGIEDAGEGVVVGVIDSGIAPENPSFAGEPLTSTPGDAPYRDGDTIVFDKADGTQFRGICQAGETFDADDCSTKLIGARYFADSYGADYIGGDRGEVVSPRDGNGHGSHTASTAAGNHGVPASVAGRDLGEISGVAPAAKVVMYKACWTGPTPSDDGCMTGDLLAAIDAAVADGVDVINYSIGGGGALSTVALTDQAFLGAAAAGIFVAASAGNDGPSGSTVDNAAPWITTVAASTIPSYEATVRTGDGQAFTGGSIGELEGVTGRLVAAAAVAAEGATDPRLCGPNSLDPGKTAGTIVLCERGIVDRVAKSAEVARAGGIAMVLANPTANSVDLDVHAVPTIHVDADAYTALSTYANTEAATAEFEDGNTTGRPSPVTPQLAGFSSRGPVLADGGDILKPDITAPGVAILADGRNGLGEDPSFELLSGTSMASPHIAGLAALYLGAHPHAAPAEIKSALMTTASDTLNADGSAYTDPFGQGAGVVEPARFLDPGLLFLNDVNDWNAYVQAIGAADLGIDPVDPSDVNLPSVAVGSLAGVQTVTRTVTATRPGSYSVQAASIPGVEVAVSPTRIDFAVAGEEKSFTITFRRTSAPLDTFATGTLRWSGRDGDAVVMPLAVRPSVIAVPTAAHGDGESGSVEIPVAAGETMDVDVTVAGLVAGRVIRGAGMAGSAPDRHVIDVPEGTTTARFELVGMTPSSDLDLALYKVDEFGGLLYLQEATSPSSRETITRADLEPGQYVLDVSFFSGEGDLDYDLTSYLLGGDPDLGEPRVDPASLALTMGETSPAKVTWSELPTGTRLYGRVIFGATGAATDLYVRTSGDVEADPVEPAVSIAPGYVRPGRTFTVSAVGMPADAPYEVALDGSVVARGTSSAVGSAARRLSLPEDAADGVHNVTVSAGPVTLTGSLVASRVLLHDVFENIEYLQDGGASVSAEVMFGGAGTVHATITGAGGTEVLREDLEVYSDPMFDADSARTSAVALTPGEYTVRAWIDGIDGPALLRERTFTVEETAPSVLTLTQNASDENSVDLVYNNSVGAVTQATIRSKTCAGPVIFGSVWIDKPVVTATFDLTGITGIDVLVDGKFAGSYANSGSARCAAETHVSHDFWVVAADPSADDAERASEVLELTVSNRYPAYSSGFDLSAGYGSDIYGDRIHDEQVAHDRVTEPGPVVSRSFAADEGSPFWVRAKYEVLTPDIHISAHRVVYAPAVTTAELQPVVDPAPPGSGEPAPGTGQPNPTTPHDGAPAEGPWPGNLAVTGGTVATTAIIAAAAALTVGTALVMWRRRRRT